MLSSTKIPLVDRPTTIDPLPSHSSLSLDSARRVRTRELETSESKWIGLEAIEWVDELGEQRHWESSYRKTTDRSSSTTDRPVDAVAIFTLITRPMTATSTIVVLQYRPPVDRIVVELPAGLLDPGETVQAAALRELYEETGYGRGPHGGTPTVEGTSEALVNDPGMSDATVVLAKVAVHFDALDPILPEPHQAQGEHIQVLLVPIKDLYQTLLDYNRKPGFVVDARLMHLAFGLSIQQLV